MNNSFVVLLADSRAHARTLNSSCNCGHFIIIILQIRPTLMPPRMPLIPRGSSWALVVWSARSREMLSAIHHTSASARGGTSQQANCLVGSATREDKYFHELVRAIAFARARADWVIRAWPLIYLRPISLLTLTGTQARRQLTRACTWAQRARLLINTWSWFLCVSHACSCVCVSIVVVHS